MHPDKIIFVSKKGKKAFDSIYSSNDYSEPKNIALELVNSIQHPNSAYWNKPVKANNGLTGKQKLIEILQSK